MSERKKRKKLWIVLALAISLITVQTMQMAAEASAKAVDFSRLVTTVDSGDELIAALGNASDGDVIGIGSAFTIESSVEIGFPEEKHIYLGRRSGQGCIEIPQNVNVTIRNMTIDGSSIDVLASNPMFKVSGTLFLENVTIQNCRNENQGGAVYVTRNGYLNTDGVIFDGNSAEQGGHIYNEGILNLNNTRLVNGAAAADGGAIKSCVNAGLMLSDCVLCGNSASSYGGGISNSGSINTSHSIAFGNSAESGADIANDRNVSFFQIDTIPGTADLYAAEGVTPTGWVFDCADTSSPELAEKFDLSNPDSLMKLDYAEQGTGGSGETGDGGNPDGDAASGDDNPGDSGDNTDGGDDNPGDSGDNADGGEDNPGGDGDNTDSGSDTPDENDSGDGSSEADGGTVSGNDAQGGNAENGGGTDSGTDGADGSTNQQDSGTSQPGTSPNSGTSGSASTVPSVTSSEDNSTTTTTNNYYTYGNPVEKDSTAGKEGTTGQGIAAPEASGQGTSRQSTSAAAVKEAETAETADASGNPESPSGMQVPDNISLNLVDVDIVYDMTDGISNIEISNAREETDFPMAETVNVEALSDLPAAADAGEDSAINWYEIVKMALLAAILLTVIPKPGPKKTKKKKRKKTAVKAAEKG